MNDNNNEKHNSSMIWMMLPCLLILGFVIFAAGGGVRSWPFILIIGGMVVAHLWMMRRGHGSQDTEDHSSHAAADPKKAESIKHGGGHSCCH